MFSWWNDHRSVHRNGHRTRSGTCGLVHKPSFDSTFQLSLRTFGKSLRAALRCSRSFLVSWVRPLHLAPAADGRATGFFYKHKMLHKKLKPLDALKGLINTRFSSVFRQESQDCNAWVDRASSGQVAARSRTLNSAT